MGKVLALLAFGAAATLSRAQTVRNLTDFPYDRFVSPSQSALDDAGTAAYVLSTTNQLGTNPRHAQQVFRWDLTSGAAVHLTSFAKGVEGALSVSDDGQWLAFVSCSDPVGSNHDASPELFVMRSDGSEIAQLTSDPEVGAGSVYSAVIAGSGDRVLFLADTDPLGTNPGRDEQLFVVERDGTGLRQLTSTSEDLYSHSISDDGNRIVFSRLTDLPGQNRYELFVIQADGTGLRQLTPPNGTGSFAAAKISGNGEKVVTSGFTDGAWRVFKVEWDGTGWLELAIGQNPSITDDADTAVYQSPDSVGPPQVWKVGTDGTGSQQLTNSPAFRAYYPVVSGGGSRIAFTAYGEVPGGSNADGGGELISLDSSGSGPLQLTNLVESGFGEYPSICADGTRAFYYSGSSAAGWSLWRIDADGGNRAFVRDVPGYQPQSLAPLPDGSAVVFAMQQPNGSWGVYKVNADGSGLVLLASSNSSYIEPVVSSDGLWIVYQNLSDVWRVRVDGVGNSRIFQDGSFSFEKEPCLADGLNPWLVYQSDSNLDNLNPDGSLELFRIRLSGVGKTRLTADPVYDSEEPDVSGDGNRVVYVSAADPLGTNSDHNDELFAYDVSTATRRQLTFTAAGESREPRISRDGAWVYFRSSAPFFETNRDGHYEPYRVSVSSGTVERLGGTRFGLTGVQDFPLSVDRNGARVVFAAYGNWGGQNPDRVEDVFLVDFTTRPALTVGKSAPTLLSWDVEPKPVRYDVIRAVSADLSVVTCIEDDSPDTDTLGYEDAVQPAAGQAFFYLCRGTQGVLDGPGSWGTGSSGSERVPGSGSCAP